MSQKDEVPRSGSEIATTVDDEPCVLIAKLTKQVIELGKQSNEQLQQLTTQVIKMGKQVSKSNRQLRQMIGYNENRAADLELKTNLALKNYLLKVLNIPEDCLIPIPNRIFLDTESGEVAVEWDGGYIVDYTDKPSDVEILSDWPTANTVFLLDCKLKIKLERVLKNLPKRIEKTIAAITSPITCKKRKFVTLLEAQKIGYGENLSVRVAIGGENLDKEMVKEIVAAGYLAIAPNAEDFEVYDSRNLYLTS